MRVIGHTRKELCPRCRAAAFCEDCALCEACSFAAPDVDLPQPPAPLPKTNRCDECREVTVHSRTCSVTRRAAAN